MRSARVVLTSWLVGSLWLAMSPDAQAQSGEPPGTRAHGMAGAFTAVADDATATWWNPAGLATGAYFSMILEGGRLGGEAADGPGVAELTGSRGGVAVAFPALGLSYGRLRIRESGPLPPIGGGVPDREDDEGDLGIRSLAISQYGVTVAQSLHDNLVVASTVKLLRGGEIRVSGSADGLMAAGQLEVEGATRVDLDIGVMASMGPIRVGLSARNLARPSFGPEAGDLGLDRQVRVGVAAVRDRLRWPINVALDADLTRTPSVLGDIRHVAAGIEGWVWGGRAALRGGASVNTAGEGGTSASGGASLQLRSGLYAVGAITRGSDQSRVGWSVGLNMTF